MPQFQSQPINTGGVILAPPVSVTAIASFSWAIPPGVRCITLFCSEVLIPTTHQVRVGTSAGLATTGYTGLSCYIGSSSSWWSNAVAFWMAPAVQTVAGSNAVMTISRIGTTNTWAFKGESLMLASNIGVSYGHLALPGELTTFVFQSGSGNFTAGGTMHLQWEF